jgi:hypothetical protein
MTLLFSADLYSVPLGRFPAAIAVNRPNAPAPCLLASRRTFSSQSLTGRLRQEGGHRNT